MIKSVLFFCLTISAVFCSYHIWCLFLHITSAHKNQYTREKVKTDYHYLHTEQTKTCVKGCILSSQKEKKKRTTRFLKSTSLTTRMVKLKNESQSMLEKESCIFPPKFYHQWWQNIHLFPKCWQSYQEKNSNGKRKVVTYKLGTSIQRKKQIISSHACSLSEQP